MLAVHLEVFGQDWFIAKFAAGRGPDRLPGLDRAPMARSWRTGMRPLENRTLRIMNEIPGIAAALIVVLVIVRPF